MARETQKNPEISYPYKRSIYTEFILWTAMPQAEKVRLGIETQTQFCEYYKIDINTPTPWKHRADFEDRVDKILKMWSTDKTPDVVHSIYRSAIKGNPMSQMLWLQYFKGFNPKKMDDEKPKVVLGAGDIRHLIDQLPEPLKQKHYGYLRELAEDVVAIRDSRGIEDGDWSERPPQAISEPADSDAQTVPGREGANDLASRHSERVCEDMGTKADRTTRTSARNY